jgi:hypothetical protein
MERPPESLKSFANRIASLAGGALPETEMGMAVLEAPESHLTFA